MSKRKIDAEELVRRILRFDDDLRDDDPRELVDAEIRDAGDDPEALRAEGEAFVKKLLAEKAEVESRKASRTRLRSPPRAASSAPPGRAPSSLPPTRPKAPSEAGPRDDGE